MAKGILWFYVIIYIFFTAIETLADKDFTHYDYTYTMIFFFSVCTLAICESIEKLLGGAKK